MASVKDITTAAELAELIDKGTVLLEFWAPWCSVCKTQGIVLEQVAVSAPADVVIAKVNVDEARELSAQYGINTVPQMFLYCNGKEIFRSGSAGKAQLLALFGA